MQKRFIEEQIVARESEKGKLARSASRYFSGYTTQFDEYLLALSPSHRGAIEPASASIRANE
jgi:hypothetical protein